ncbi:hypothetical protein FACS189434_09230 [Bacteroidia bacterium]|nr:hypothetical protein FACS189434_09230 [Bacteroidia bacterium]
MKQIHAYKIAGELRDKERIFWQIEAAFSTLKNGDYKITILKKKEKRSLDQNRLMWLWFNCMAMETGSTKDDFHDYYCTKFLGRTAIINGIERQIAGSTSGLDTTAFTHFLNQIQADAAAEFGIKLPTPEDEYWAEFENYYKSFNNI